ncbi:Uncharacterized protein Rs2_40870 [Raphanus sativus]|nr:Uncharacterized protein Rs2_40870 [Raphanus sativus]
MAALEDQFATDDYTDLNKLALAVYLIGGEAEAFVQRRHEIKYFETWKDLKTSLLWWFGEPDDPDRKQLEAKRDESVLTERVTVIQEVKDHLVNLFIHSTREVALLEVDSKDSLEPNVDCDFVDDESRRAAKEIQERAVLELQVASEGVPPIHVREEGDSTTKVESTDLMQENEVSNSVLEPSHKIDDMQTALLENSSSQLLDNDSRNESYILDVDEVGELTQKISRVG